MSDVLDHIGVAWTDCSRRALAVVLANARDTAALEGARRAAARTGAALRKRRARTVETITGGTDMAKFNDVAILMDAYKRLERIDTAKLKAAEQLAHADALDGLRRAIHKATQAHRKDLSPAGEAAKRELEAATKRLEKRLESLKKPIAVIEEVNAFVRAAASLWKGFGTRHTGPQPVPHTESVTNEPFVPIEVYYATDRKMTAASGDRACRFGPGRNADGALSYGVCKVTVPATHRIGELESPTWWRLEFHPDPAKHIVLHDTTPLAGDPFFHSVAATVAKSPRRDAFVFVHGFNVSFEDAARRAAQMTFDLEFQGAPIIYSWPSRAGVLDYMADEASAIWTAPHLERFLEELAARSGAERIHVIAHSMGNRAVCDALERLSHRAWAGRSMLRHLVLTAPDIDAATFIQMAAALRTTAESVTLYASSNDKPLLLSQKLHRYPRAGTPLVIVAGVETVDASAVNTDFLGHSFFSDTRTILSDIFSLLRHDHLAGERHGLRARKRDDQTYYVVRKSRGSN